MESEVRLTKKQRAWLARIELGAGAHESAAFDLLDKMIALKDTP
jgi:hypothetical protein